jgi:carbon-monoxide dehydrogenase iron sulfur subunit
MEPMGKVLKIDYEKCTGCRLCEQVCAVKHDGVSNPARSRIKVMKWEMEGLYIPMACQQCQDAPCLNSCPVGAITYNQQKSRVEVDYDICIGCRTCVQVCPFGAMNFNTVSRKVFKCYLCDGDPQCARFCEVQCITFVDAGDVSIQKKRDAAQRLHAAARKADGFSLEAC